VPYAVYSIIVTGSTLLATYGTELLYFDTATLQQTGSAAVPEDSFLFGVSADGAEIYLYAETFAGPSVMAVLDLASGATLVLRQFPAYNLGIVLLSPDGRRIVVAGSSMLVIDPSTLETIGTVVPMGVTGAAFLGSQTVLLLIGSFGGGVSMAVIDQSTAQVTAAFPVDAAEAPEEESAVADPKMGAIWVGGYGLSVVSVASNRVVRSFFGYGFSPGARVGDRIYGAFNSSPAVYDLAAEDWHYLPGLSSHVNFVDVFPGAASSDGKRYWAPFIVHRDADGPQSPSGGIGIFNTTSNTLAARIAPPGYQAGPFVFGPDDATAYVACTNAIAVYDARTLRTSNTFIYATTFSALAVSSDGSALYATDGTSVYVLDSATGAQRQLYQFQSPKPYDPFAMALSPDGTTLFVTDPGSETVDLIDTASGQARQVPIGAGSWIGVLPSN
jgi:YVTN family beta-propeller protein